MKKILKKLRAKANEESLEFVSGRGHIKTQLQRDIEALEAALEKLKEYEKKLHICADRGSYAKTDPDATFMHMKDDHMRNGQLKPASIPFARRKDRFSSLSYPASQTIRSNTKERSSSI